MDPQPDSLWAELRGVVREPETWWLLLRVALLTGLLIGVCYGLNLIWPMPSRRC